MKHPKLALILAMLGIAAVLTGVYWAVRGIPLRGKVARALEERLSRAFDMEVAFDHAWLHPPGTVTIKGLRVQEAGDPPLTMYVEALRLATSFWSQDKRFDIDARGTVFEVGKKTSPFIPQIKTRLYPETDGLSWDAIRFSLPLFGQPARGVLSSGYLRNTAEAGERRLLEYRTDMDINVEAFGVWARFVGNELNAELIGRVGYGPGEALPLSASFSFSEGKIWIDPLRVGTGPDLEASVDISTSTLTLSKADGAVEAEITLDLAHDRLDGRVSLQHWMLGQTDLVSRNHFEVEWNPREDKSGIIRGVLDVPDLIVNLEPRDPLKISFELDAEQMKLQELRWGEHYRAEGSLNFKTRDLDLLVDAAGVEMQKLRAIGADPGEGVSGRMDGTVAVKGPFFFPEVEGHMAVTSGKHPELGPFDSMNIHFRGRGGKWELYDSTIYKEMGSFLLTGYIGLNAEGLYKSLVVHGNEGVMVLGGWDVSGAEQSAIHGDKEVGDKFKVNFKTYLEEASGARDEKDEFGVEYGLSQNDSLMMRLRGEEQFLGVKRKNRF